MPKFKEASSASHLATSVQSFSDSEITFRGKSYNNINHYQKKLEVKRNQLCAFALVNIFLLFFWYGIYKVQEQPWLQIQFFEESNLNQTDQYQYNGQYYIDHILIQSANKSELVSLTNLEKLARNYSDEDGGGSDGKSKEHVDLFFGASLSIVKKHMSIDMTRNGLLSALLQASVEVKILRYLSILLNIYYFCHMYTFVYMYRHKNKDPYITWSRQGTKNSTNNN